MIVASCCEAFLAVIVMFPFFGALCWIAGAICEYDKRQGRNRWRDK